MTRATVLAYHAIGDCPRSEDRHNLFVSTENFERQMAFLARRRQVVPLADIVDGRIPDGKPVVAITFDDGYRNVLRNAEPILTRHGFPSTIFVPTKWRGLVNGWNEPTSCDLEIMDDDELRQSEEAGILLESHGHGHIDMSEGPHEDVANDIKTSLDELEVVTGRRPRFLAYPFGRTAPWTLKVAGSAGLSAAFTIDELHAGRFAYERTQITPLDGSVTFALKTAGNFLKVRQSKAVAGTYRTVKPLVRKVLQRKRA